MVSAATVEVLWDLALFGVCIWVGIGLLNSLPPPRG